MPKKNKLSIHPICAYACGPLSKLLREANQDTDKASMFWLTPESVPVLEQWRRGRVTADGAIIIIKGGAESMSVAKFLINAGLLTEGKPVTGSKPTR